MRNNLRLNRSVGAGFCIVFLACAGGDLTLPNQGSPVMLTALSGGGQEAKVGSRLPDPLVVRVTDGAQRPVAQVPLIFQFQDEFPDAEIEPALVETDSTGLAEVRVRLGTTTGPQIVEALLAQDPAADARATFGVTALERNGQPGGGDSAGGDEDEDRGKRKEKDQ